MTRAVLRCMPVCAALLSACSEQSTPAEAAAGSAAALVLPCRYDDALALLDSARHAISRDEFVYRPV